MSDVRLLTVPEVADLLRLRPFTIRKYARLRVIKCARKVGGDWRFDRGQLAKQYGITLTLP